MQRNLTDAFRWGFGVDAHLRLIFWLAFLYTSFNEYQISNAIKRDLLLVQSDERDSKAH